jgi:hypothetical protein
MTNQVRLDSWKEIATYLKHDERTAQRWHANKGLPVHHVPGSIGSSVFAYIAEVDRWLNSTSGDDAPGASDPGTHVYAFEAMELWGCRSAENICRIIELSHKARSSQNRLYTGSVSALVCIRRVKSLPVCP